MAEDQTDTKLVVYTVIVRLPKDAHPVWSVYAIDTKAGYYDDIVDYSVIELGSEVSA